MEKSIPVVIVGGSRQQGNQRIQKTVANYIGAVMEEFSRGAEAVMLRARGKAISLAVDTSQKLGRLPGYAADDVARVGTEAVGVNGDKVSFIEIVVRLNQ